jgi:fatty acid desaturase
MAAQDQQHRQHHARTAHAGDDREQFVGFRPSVQRPF